MAQSQGILKTKMIMTSRRQFIKQSALMGVALPLANSFIPGEIGVTQQKAPPVYLFSKHLQFLDYQDMARKAKEIGFDGVELTVREGGHVNPDNVESELPAAVRALKKAGLKADLMVSDLTEVGERSQRVLSTAAAEGIKKYRMGYYDYPDDKSMPETLSRINEIGQELTEINRRLGIQGMHQNHAGDLVGSSIWEIWMMLENIDPEFMGSQYDIRHALVEGGFSWPNGIRLLRDKIATVAIKDFKWVETDGEWDLINTPLGEGMVDFKEYFGILKGYGLNVPMTLHLEYDLFGAEHGQKTLANDKREKVYEAMSRDLTYLRTSWNEA